MPYPWSAGNILTAADLNAATDARTAWTSYSPIYTTGGWGIGTGGAAAAVGAYSITNGTVHFWAALTFGTGGGSAAGTGACGISLPVVALSATAYAQSFLTRCIDVSSGQLYHGAGLLASTTIVTPYVSNTSATYEIPNSLTTTVPFTWAAGDTIAVTGWYRSA